jgi:hypothetical protein
VSAALPSISPLSLSWASPLPHAQAAGGAAKKRLDGAVGWFKGLGGAATSLVAGKSSSDAAEDPEYVKVWAQQGRGVCACVRACVRSRVGRWVGVRGGVFVYGFGGWGAVGGFVFV